MPSIQYDLAFLQAGIPELQGYLLSHEIYWPLGLAAPLGERPYPRMTLGWLLLAQTHARGWLTTDLYPAQTTVVENLSQEMAEMRGRWQTAWAKKAAQEFSSRLKLWVNFINDYRGDKGGYANQYPYDVQRRVILHLLVGETDQIPPIELVLLREMDGYLRAVLKTGEFMWDKEVASMFPPSAYWYLYGNLPNK